MYGERNRVGRRRQFKDTKREREAVCVYVHVCKVGCNNECMYILYYVQIYVYLCMCILYCTALYVCM